MQNLILVGITGVGKTTIGKLLAEQLNKQFIDLDKQIELRCGVDISTIFHIEKEDGFRKRETLELKDTLAKKDNFVLSLGGGCVTQQVNRQLIKASNNIVVQLFADLRSLINRLANSINKRPLLENVALEDKLIELRKERQKFYDEVATFTVDTTNLQPAEAVKKVIDLLSNKNVLV